MERPSWIDSEYLIKEVGNWHLRDDAPPELVKEFEHDQKVSRDNI